MYGCLQARSNLATVFVELYGKLFIPPDVLGEEVIP
jgi:hypothetical protein